MDFLFSSPDTFDEEDAIQDPDFRPGEDEDEGSDDEEDNEEDGAEDEDEASSVGGSQSQQSASNAASSTRRGRAGGRRSRNRRRGATPLASPSLLPALPLAGSDGVARRTRAKHSLFHADLDQLAHELPSVEWEEQEAVERERQEERMREENERQMTDQTTFDASFLSPPPLLVPDTPHGHDACAAEVNPESAYFARFRQLLTSDNLDDIDHDDDAPFEPDNEPFEEDVQEEYRNDRTVAISKKEIQSLRTDSRRNLE